MQHGDAGSLMDRLVVGRQFGRAFETTLAGLKHHIETGELVDEFQIERWPGDDKREFSTCLTCLIRAEDRENDGPDAE